MAKNAQQRKARVRVSVEPELLGPLSNLEMAKIQGFYISTYSTADMIPWVVEWAEINGYDKSTISLIKSKGKKWISSSTSISCRLENRGTILTPYQRNRIKEALDVFLKNLEKYDTEDVVLNYENTQEKIIPLILNTTKKTPADVVNEKQDKILAQLESLLDEYQANTDYSVYKTLQKEDAPQRIAKKIVDSYTPLYEDEDTTGEFKKFVGCIISESQKFYDEKAQMRKPREVKKKLKPMVNQVKCLESGLGIVSENPEDLDGALMVIVYNTNLSMLGFYKSKDASGIKIDRQTFLNYDEKMSQTKRVVKLENLLGEIKSMTSLEFLNMFNSLKNNPKPMLSRINDSCLIVKIIK